MKQVNKPTTIPDVLNQMVDCIEQITKEFREEITRLDNDLDKANKRIDEMLNIEKRIRINRLLKSVRDWFFRINHSDSLQFFEQHGIPKSFLEKIYEDLPVMVEISEYIIPSDELLGELFKYNEVLILFRKQPSDHNQWYDIISRDISTIKTILER